MNKALDKRVLDVMRNVVLILFALALVGCSTKTPQISGSDGTSEKVSSTQPINMEDMCFVLLDSRCNLGMDKVERVSIKEARQHLYSNYIKLECEDGWHRLTIPDPHNGAYDGFFAMRAYCKCLGQYGGKHVVTYGGTHGGTYRESGIVFCWQEGDYIYIKDIDILHGDDSVFGETMSQKGKISCNGLISTYTLARLAGLDEKTVGDGPYLPFGDGFKYSCVHDLKTGKTDILSIDIEEPNSLRKGIKQLIAFKMEKESDATIHITKKEIPEFLKKFGEAYKAAVSKARLKRNSRGNQGLTIDDIRDDM